MLAQQAHPRVVGGIGLGHHRGLVLAAIFHHQHLALIRLMVEEGVNGFEAWRKTALFVVSGDDDREEHCDWPGRQAESTIRIDSRYSIDTLRPACTAPRCANWRGSPSKPASWPRTRARASPPRPP